MASVSHMQRLKAIVDAYTHDHGSSDKWVAERMGMSRQTLSSWWNTGLASMPSPHQLFQLSVATRTSYRDVLDAALADFEYLPEASAAASEPTARMNRRGSSTGRQMRQAQDDAEPA